MLQDSIILKSRYERFIKKVCETGIVYGLESDEGYATSSSNKTEDKNRESVGLICFWSEKALANSCVKDEWGEYQVTGIPLSEFIENWCEGMNSDGFFVGINFDHNMYGYEAAPLELIERLEKELKQKK